MTYELAAGTIRGTAHRNNNQDAFAYGQAEGITVALVADGCSGGKYSEVGSTLFCHMLQAELLRLLSIGKHYRPPKTFMYCLERSVRRVCSHMDMLTTWSSRSHIIENYFLFTLVGCAIVDDQVYLFNLGDGCIVLNGEKLECDTGGAKTNMPPYLAYRITDVESAYDLEFKITQCDVTAFDSALIGSDGVNDLIKLEDVNFPGTENPIGPISQFWTNDLFFRNPDCVRRTLFRVNREKYTPRLNLSGKPTLKRHPGLLGDDTTLIAIRKVSNPNE